MSLFFYTAGGDLRRLIGSFRFAIAVIGLSGVTLLTLWDELQYTVPGETSITYIRLLIDYWNFNMVYLLFAAIPSATVFCTDWENRYIRFSVLRSSKRIYAASKAMACFFSAFLVVALSEWLNIFLLSFWYPVTNGPSEMDFGVYQVLADQNLVPLYFGIEILFKSLCAGFLCVFALWVSTKVTNVFITLAAPLLLFYVVNTVSAALRLPGILSIAKLSRGFVAIGYDPALSVIYTAGVFLAASLLCSLAFVRSCRRRIING